MDFEVNYEYTPEQQAFRKEVAEWLDAHAPKRQPLEPGAQLPREQAEARQREDREWRMVLGAQGWLVPTAPKELGGGGLTPAHALVINEELAKRHLPASSGPGILMPAIMIHGTEEQKQRFVKANFQGKVGVTQMFTEPEAGSDLASLKTRGVRDGDEWVINGSKHFVGSPSDWCFILVNTNPEAPRHENISLFMIDGKAPGITVTRMDLITSIGGTGGPNLVFFDNVRVPHENLIGQEGKGWAIANTTLELEHGGSGTMGGGPTGGALSGNPEIVHRVIEYLRAG